MDLLNAPLRVVLKAYVGLFGGAHPLVSLVPLSILVGLAMLWVFKKTSNQKAIERAKKKMQAYLLELRLFGDDPSLIFQTQGRLLASNLRYLGLMLKPALFLTIPMIVLLYHLDAIYGIRPLPEGATATVTVQANARLSPLVQPPTIEAPAGIQVETPAVRGLDTGRFSWRVRAEEEANGPLRFRWNGAEWTKSIAAGEQLQYVSHRRDSGILGRIAAPGEPGLGVEQLKWVEVRYPASDIETAGIRLHWLIWFFAVSVISAYLLKDLFGVKI